MRYNLEICTAETGEEDTQNYVTLSEVFQLLRLMKEGDSIVVNAVKDEGRRGSVVI
jgi:hypothetical protein